MAETFGSFSTLSATREQETPARKEPFRFKFDWRLFWIYGAFWCVIFFAIVCVQKAGYFVYNQHRRIQDLIDRIHQYENPDWNDRDDVSPDGNDSDSSLSAWVRNNLPAKGVEERPAVAGVFNNLADMLDEGSLQGEKDAFSEGIAQLQPVATRKIWLNFLTKLTKKIHAARLDNRRLAEAFRVIAKAIYPASKASVLLLESATPQPPRRLLRAGGSLRSSSRKAVRRHNSAALCRSAPLRPLQQPQGGLRDGLTKRAFCRRSPPFFAAVAAVALHFVVSKYIMKGRCK